MAARPHGAVAVAYSGGRDSTALLFATLAACGPIGIDVAALHVHHGLNPDADDWLLHCEMQCRAWAKEGHALRFLAERLEAAVQTGESIEAWARRARYGALRRMAITHGAGIVLLGHHRRDQAETFLLQALRGGGVAGLAAMPRSIESAGITWARPWLDVSSDAIEAYALANHLRWIEDSSNADPRFARNRLRREVWPVLEAAFPDAVKCLATAARWAAQAAEISNQAAADDLAHVTTNDMLGVAAWRSLSPARQSNVLRAWLHLATGGAAPASLVERLLAEAGAPGAREWPAAGGRVILYRGTLRWARGRAAVASPSPIALDAHQPGCHALTPWRGVLHVQVVAQGGVSIGTATSLEVRARAPGDRFQGGPRRPPRGLKLQYQSAGVPAHERGGPVFCFEGRIVFVPGLGIDARFVASPGEPQLSLSWLISKDDSRS